MSLEDLKYDESQELNFEEYDKTHSFDIDKKPPPNQALVWCNGRVIGTKGGNIICISGLAKSRKSVVVSAIASGMFLNGETDYLNFKARIPEEENILHIDTEQGYYHYYHTVMRMIDHGGGSLPGNFMSRHTRDATVSFRIQYLEYLFQKNKPRACIIDGITDFVRDPNDSGESSDLITKLYKLSSDYDTLMILVIHTTKSAMKLRGHIGSELERKCETAIRVTKDDDNDNFSHVECRESRNRPFEAYTIYFDTNQELYRVLGDDNEDFEVKSKKKKEHEVEPDTFKKHHHRSVINKIFEQKPFLAESDLLTAIQNRGTSGQKKLTRGSAKKWLHYYNQNVWVYMNPQESKWEKTKDIDLDETNTLELFEDDNDELPF